VGCDGLENAIESGQVRTRSTTAMLERHLAPVKDSNADVVGLSCTHYPFLRSRIKSILGPGVTLYDPSRPVARRVRQLLTENDAFAVNPKPAFRFYTTGNAEVVRRVAGKLLRIPVARVEHIDL
ncbi:MAG: glutamate racemase, partial [Chloroflexota bacterium]